MCIYIYIYILCIMHVYIYIYIYIYIHMCMYMYVHCYVLLTSPLGVYAVKSRMPPSPHSINQPRKTMQ